MSPCSSLVRGGLKKSGFLGVSGKLFVEVSDQVVVFFAML